MEEGTQVDEVKKAGICVRASHLRLEELVEQFDEYVWVVALSVKCEKRKYASMVIQCDSPRELGTLNRHPSRNNLICLPGIGFMGHCEHPPSSHAEVLGDKYLFALIVHPPLAKSSQPNLMCLHLEQHGADTGRHNYTQLLPVPGAVTSDIFRKSLHR
jgi:hypothetical protein